MSKPKFAAAPKPANLSADALAFIESGHGKDRAPHAIEEEAPAEPTHRMSIDVPKSLHKRFKVACAMADTKMVPEVVKLIIQRVEELEEQNAKH